MTKWKGTKTNNQRKWESISNLQIPTYIHLYLLSYFGLTEDKQIKIN